MSEKEKALPYAGEEIPHFSITLMSMRFGVKDKPTKVIDRGVVKVWAGIGWLETDETPDPAKMPTVTYPPA